MITCDVSWVEKVSGNHTVEDDNFQAPVKATSISEQYEDNADNFFDTRGALYKKNRKVFLWCFDVAKGESGAQK